MTSPFWQNRLPDNRLKNDRWVEFVDVLEEMWGQHLEPELLRLANIMKFTSIQEDRELRMKEWGTRFLATATHIAPELGVEQAQALNMLKNTETLWRAYGRQLGFEEEDIIVETQFSENEEEYGKGKWAAQGRLPTSRISLVLSIDNARWYLQPVSSPSNLLQEYANQTKPAHIVLEPAVLQIPEDTVNVYTTNYSGYECERICRISY